jgi:hypothetical protein
MKGKKWAEGLLEHAAEENTGSMSNEAASNWRKVHGEELHWLHSSQNVFWVIKSRNMR